MNDHDRAMMEWVRKFNPYDLYSKGHEPPDVEALKPYYQDLIAEFFPVDRVVSGSVVRPEPGSRIGRPDLRGLGVPTDDRVGRELARRRCPRSGGHDLDPAVRPPSSRYQVVTIARRTTSDASPSEDRQASK